MAGLNLKEVLRLSPQDYLIEALKQPRYYFRGQRHCCDVPGLKMFVYVDRDKRVEVEGRILFSNGNQSNVYTVRIGKKVRLIIKENQGDSFFIARRLGDEHVWLSVNGESQARRYVLFPEEGTNIPKGCEIDIKEIGKNYLVDFYSS